MTDQTPCYIGAMTTSGFGLLLALLPTLRVR
jgi:hypothetical protein